MVFEKVMYNHIITFMNRTNVLYDELFGFRQNHSTHQSIVRFVDKITTFLDAGDIVIYILLDLKKTLTR